MTDRDYMTLALAEAEKCFGGADVPVGAVMVRRGELLAAAGNRRETDGDATAHAEMLCIRQACERLGGWHLTDCTLYVTLEPCPMCAGAIVNARVDRVVYGARNSRFGACGGLFALYDLPLNHRPEVTGGVMAEEAQEQLRRFFAEKRTREKGSCRRFPPFPAEP